MIALYIIQLIADIWLVLFVLAHITGLAVTHTARFERRRRNNLSDQCAKRAAYESENVVLRKQIEELLSEVKR